MAEDDRGAVLQFEIDRKRWLGVASSDFVRANADISSEDALARLRFIARTAINDTIRNCGTFVLVATKDTITMVQRPDAEPLSGPESKA